MATSLQVTDALKILSGEEFTPKLTFGDVWEGDHQSFGFIQMKRDDMKHAGKSNLSSFIIIKSNDY